MFKILTHYWPEIKRHKWWIILMLFGMLGNVVFELLIPYVLRNFADIIAIAPNPEKIKEIFQILTSLGVLYFFLWIDWRLNEFAVIHFETKAMRDIENRAFNYLQKQSIRFFKNSFTGGLVKKVNRFSHSFETLVDIVYYNFLRELLTILAIFTVFTLEKPLLGISFGIWAIIYLGASYWFAIWKSKYDLLSAAADSHVSAALADSLGNYASVKTFAREESENTRFRETTFDRFKKRKFTWILHFYANTVQGFFMLGFELMLFWFAAQWWTEGNFSIGDFVFFQSYVIWLFHALWDFSRHIQRFFQNLANAKEMVDIFENKIEIVDRKNASKLKINKGQIEFKNINFRFPEDENKLFKEFSLKIKSGEKIALVGPSGSGKSTIVNLLFRFFDPQSGQILIDEQDIKQVTQKSLRRHLSLVPQNPDLFHRSIRDNIAFGNPTATLDEVKKVAQLSHAHKFIEKLPNQYQTLVGERGVKLSGGEKQRVAIARAFLENAPILVLDEATSSLDSLAEKSIQAAIYDLMEDRTSIVIAHRLSTILRMDRIIVIKDGQFIEQGTHQELIDKKGLYAQLWEHQAGGFIGEE